MAICMGLIGSANLGRGAAGCNRVDPVGVASARRMVRRHCAARERKYGMGISGGNLVPRPYGDSSEYSVSDPGLSGSARLITLESLRSVAG